MKIVISTRHGGFGLSMAALVRLRELCHPMALAEVVGPRHFCSTPFLRDIPRNDPMLLQVVEELGEAASGWRAELVVEEVSGDWYVHEEDGYESIRHMDPTYRGVNLVAP